MSKPDKLNMKRIRERFGDPEKSRAVHERADEEAIRLVHLVNEALEGDDQKIELRVSMVAFMLWHAERMVEKISQLTGAVKAIREFLKVFDEDAAPEKMRDVAIGEIDQKLDKLIMKALKELGIDPEGKPTPEDAKRVAAWMAEKTGLNVTMVEGDPMKGIMKSIAHARPIKKDENGEPVLVSREIAEAE